MGREEEEEEEDRGRCDRSIVKPTHAPTHTHTHINTMRQGSECGEERNQGSGNEPSSAIIRPELEEKRRKMRVKERDPPAGDR